MLYIEDRFPLYYRYGILAYCMVLLLLFTGLSVVGGGITANYTNRLIFTAFIVAPVALALNFSFFYGLCLVVASFGLIKVLQNNAFVSNSTLHLLAFLVFIRSLICKKKIYTSYTYSEIALLLLLLLSAVQIFFSDFLARALKLYMGMLEVFFFIYVIAPRLTKIQAKYLLTSYLFGMSILSLMLLSTYDWSLMPRLGWDIGLNPNNLALYMTSSIAICCFGWSTRGEFKRFFLLALLFTCCLFLASSRGFTIGLILAVFIANIRNWKVLLALTLTAIVGVGVIHELDSRNVIVAGHFMKGVNDDGTIDYSELSNKRWRLLTGGIKVFLEHPLTGVGFGNFSNTVRIDRERNSDGTAKEGYLVAHNVYISTIVETGIFGLLLLLAWNLSVYYHFYRKKFTLGLVLTTIFMFIGFLSGTYFDIEYALPWALAFAADDLRVGRKRKAYLVWPEKLVAKPVLLA